MASSLSNLADHLTEGIHKTKCQQGHNNKKCETCGIKYKDCECCLAYTNVKDDLIEYKCFCCNKNYHKKFDENLKKRFGNTYKFSNHDIKKLTFLLRQGVYPYEYMDDWGKSNESLLLKRTVFVAT